MDTGKVNKEFDWTGLGEISGFGGGYEQACRDMVVAGVKWLREHPNADLKARKATLLYPDLRSASKDMDEFQDVIAAACKEGATGAMVCAATKHAFFIHRKGWEEYCKAMSGTSEG